MTLLREAGSDIEVGIGRRLLDLSFRSSRGCVFLTPFDSVSCSMKNDPSPHGKNPSRLIDGKIKEPGDWRGDMLAKGARLKDPSRLFNSRLDGNVRRAIDRHGGDKVNVSSFTALIREARALNRSSRPA